MGHGIPFYSKLLDGNPSDKNINHDLIPEMVKRMRTLGRWDFINAADSALITDENPARVAAIAGWEAWGTRRPPEAGRRTNP
jgi:hypothetical protein